MSATTPVVSVKLVRDRSTPYGKQLRTQERVAEFWSALHRKGEPAGEELWVVCLDTKLQPLCTSMVARGTTDRAFARPADFLRIALMCNATAIVVIHNHPSGDPLPSDSDCELTGVMAEAAAMLGIELLDHIVIGDGSWKSASAQ